MAPTTALNGRAGRSWLNRDPIGLLGGTNVYSYVGNNPFSGIDPLGLWTFQLGITLNFQLSGIGSVSFAAGVAIDGSGNIAGYSSVGPGLAVGAKGSGVISIAGSNAPTVRRVFQSMTSTAG